MYSSILDDMWFMAEHLTKCYNFEYYSFVSCGENHHSNRYADSYLRAEIDVRHTRNSLDVRDFDGSILLCTKLLKKPITPV